MKGSFFRNKTVQRVIQWAVALSFALFTVSQIFLAIQIDTNRIGRLIGITFYLLLTIASFFAFSDKKKPKTIRLVLLVTGLLLLFIMRLMNLPTVFTNLLYGDRSSALYCLVYVLSQLGALILPVGYLMALRTDLTEKEERKMTYILMSIVIVLYAACFVLECVLMLKYGVNIDLSLKFTLLCRLLYFIGFAGTALCLMLPSPKSKRRAKPGKFVYSDDDDDEIDLVL